MLKQKTLREDLKEIKINHTDFDDEGFNRFCDEEIDKIFQAFRKRVPKKKIIGEYIEFPITDSDEDEWRRKAIIIYGKRLGMNQILDQINKELK